jgi:hypothetical protein
MPDINVGIKTTDTSKRDARLHQQNLETIEAQNKAVMELNKQQAELEVQTLERIKDLETKAGWKARNMDEVIMFLNQARDWTTSLHKSKLAVNLLTLENQAQGIVKKFSDDVHKQRNRLAQAREDRFMRTQAFSDSFTSNARTLGSRFKEAKEVYKAWNRQETNYLPDDKFQTQGSAEEILAQVRARIKREPNKVEAAWGTLWEASRGEAADSSSVSAPDIGEALYVLAKEVFMPDILSTPGMDSAARELFNAGGEPIPEGGGVASLTGDQYGLLRDALDIMSHKMLVLSSGDDAILTKVQERYNKEGSAADVEFMRELMQAGGDAADPEFSRAMRFAADHYKRYSSEINSYTTSQNEALVTDTLLAMREAEAQYAITSMQFLGKMAESGYGELYAHLLATNSPAAQFLDMVGNGDIKFTGPGFVEAASKTLMQFAAYHGGVSEDLAELVKNNPKSAQFLEQLPEHLAAVAEIAGSEKFNLSAAQDRQRALDALGQATGIAEYMQNVYMEDGRISDKEIKAFQEIWTDPETGEVFMPVVQKDGTVTRGTENLADVLPKHTFNRIAQLVTGVAGPTTIYEKAAVRWRASEAAAAKAVTAAKDRDLDAIPTAKAESLKEELEAASKSAREKIDASGKPQPPMTLPRGLMDDGGGPTQDSTEQVAVQIPLPETPDTGYHSKLVQDYWDLSYDKRVLRDGDHIGGGSMGPGNKEAKEKRGKEEQKKISAAKSGISIGGGGGGGDYNAPQMYQPQFLGQGPTQGQGQQVAQRPQQQAPPQAQIPPGLQAPMPQQAGPGARLG